MKQKVYACYALSDTEKQQLLESYRHEQLALLTETAEGRLLLKEFAGALLDRAFALSEVQQKALRRRAGTGKSQPEAIKAVLDELFADLPEPEKPAVSAAEPKLKTSPKRKTAPIVKLAASAKPDAGKTDGAAKPKPAEEKPVRTVPKTERSKPVVWSWQPPETEESGSAAAEKKEPASDPIVKKRMEIALANCRQLAILPALLTKPQKSSRLLSRGWTGGMNGIAYIDGSGRLSCLNAKPEYEEALGNWERLKSLRVMESDGVLIGERTDGMVHIFAAAGREKPADLLVTRREAANAQLLSPKNKMLAQCCGRLALFASDEEYLDYAVSRSLYLILCKDGRVLAGGNGKSRYFSFDVPVKAIAAGDNNGVMLDEAGRVFLVSSVDASPHMMPWSRVIAVQISGELIVGLQSSGVLLTTADRPVLAEQLAAWKNVAAFAVRSAEGLKEAQIYAQNNSGTVLSTKSLGIHGKKIDSGVRPIP